MFIRFQGSSAVDIDGHDGVEPNDVVDVTDELGERLLLAGWSFTEPDEDGNVIATAPAEPLWVRASAKEFKASEAAKAAGEPAPAPAPDPVAEATTTEES